MVETAFSAYDPTMIRFVLRFIGLIGLALGFIFLVYDGTKSIANQGLELTTVATFWNQIYAKTPQEVLRPAVEKVFADWLWDPVILPVLNAPVCLVLALLGSLLIVIGRKKRKLIGYARD